MSCGLPTPGIYETRPKKVWKLQQTVQAEPVTLVAIALAPTAFFLPFYSLSDILTEGRKMRAQVVEGSALYAGNGKTLMATASQSH